MSLRDQIIEAVETSLGSPIHPSEQTAIENEADHIIAALRNPDLRMDILRAMGLSSRVAFLAPRLDEAGGWFSWNHKYAKGTERVLIIWEPAS